MTRLELMKLHDDICVWIDQIRIASVTFAMHDLSQREEITALQNENVLLKAQLKAKEEGDVCI